MLTSKQHNSGKVQHGCYLANAFPSSCINERSMRFTDASLTLAYHRLVQHTTSEFGHILPILIQSEAVFCPQTRCFQVVSKPYASTSPSAYMTELIKGLRFPDIVPTPWLLFFDEYVKSSILTSEPFDFFLSQ
jgi:hypothetical protein